MHQTTRKLTRRQAWIKIAKSFNSAYPDKISQYGLCYAVNMLIDLRAAITSDMWCAMTRQIRKYRKIHGIEDIYFWPLGERKKRAALARKFAYSKI